MSSCVFKTRLDKYQQHLDNYLAKYKDSDCPDNIVLHKLQHKVAKYRYLSQRQAGGSGSNSDSGSDSCSDSDEDNISRESQEVEKLDDLIDQFGGFVWPGDTQATKDLKNAVANKKGMLQGSLYGPIIKYIGQYSQSRKQKGHSVAYTKNACRNVRKILKKRSYFDSLTDKFQKLLYTTETFSFDEGSKGATRARSQTNCENNGLQTIFKICVMDQILGRLLDFMMKPLNLSDTKYMTDQQVALIQHLSTNSNDQADHFFMSLQQVIHQQSMERGFHTGRNLRFPINIPPTTFNRIHETISHHKYLKEYTQIIKAAIEIVDKNPTYNTDDKVDLIRQLKNSIVSTAAPGQYGRAQITFEGPAPHGGSMVAISLQSLQQADYAATDTHRPTTSAKRAVAKTVLNYHNREGVNATNTALANQRRQIIEELSHQPLHNAHGRYIMFSDLQQQQSYIKQNLKQFKSEIAQRNTEIEKKKKILTAMGNNDELKEIKKQTIEEKKALETQVDELKAEMKPSTKAYKHVEAFFQKYGKNGENLEHTTDPTLIDTAEAELREIENSYPNGLLNITSARENYRNSLDKMDQERLRQMNARINPNMAHSAAQAQQNIAHQSQQQFQVAQAAQNAQRSQHTPLTGQAAQLQGMLTQHQARNNVSPVSPVSPRSPRSPGSPGSPYHPVRSQTHTDLGGPLYPTSPYAQPTSPYAQPTTYGQPTSPYAQPTAPPYNHTTQQIPYAQPPYNT